MEENNYARRSSSRTSNPNVFSDDYAVDLSDSIGAPSPTDSIDGVPEELNPDPHSDLHNNPREYTPPSLLGNTFSPNRSSFAKRSLIAEPFPHPNRALSTSSRSVADTRRTLSTSSRFSIPRTVSPYRGPTAPSQPYGLYPQATRAPSIVSDATIRPSELPFIPQGGPEHPYTMYPQNTVSEDDSSDINVGLGFPGMSREYQQGPVPSGNELGDIVGRDGHIEQLPPYSRYADNVIAKGDMARIESQRTNTTEESAPPLVIPTAEASASDVELTAVGPQRSLEEVARKEGLKEKKGRRACCGLPLWTLLVVFATIVLAAILGGVIGGVVGNQHGTQHAAIAYVDH